MKYLFLIIIVCYVESGLAQSGKRDIVKEYREANSLEGNYPYIYSYTTKGGIMKQHYLYYKKNKLYVLAFFEAGVDSVIEKFFQSDFLFKTVKQNLKPLIKLKNAKLNIEKFRKEFGDSSRYFNQIGIRVNRLHFNHFQQTDEMNLSSIKDDKEKEGLMVIKSIAAFFENQIPGKPTK